MERLIAKMGMNFKNGPTPHRGAGPKPAKRRHYAFFAVAFLAALAVGLLFLLPGGLLQAQDDGMTEYSENGMDAVATFTADDPEDRMVYWSLETANVTGVDGIGDDDEDDHAHFSISASGVLSFRFSPDYEMPRGQAKTDGNTNTYRVVVVASDDPTGAGTDGEGAGIMMGYKKVTVNVTDVDEPGMVTLSAQHGQVGVALTATLTDDDATSDQIDDAKWKWEHSSTENGPWTEILTTTDSGYTPLGVEDKYLRVTATYTDEHGSDKSEMAVSAHAVRAAPPNNAAPVFTDENDDTQDIEVGRKVDENSPPGTNVGKPVTANDAPGDVLTYTIGGINGSLYRVDSATGQITVGPRTALNRETIGGAFTHTVTVTATDPFGATTGATTQEVTITINDVNEAPAITAGVTMASVDENTAIADEVSTYTATDVDQDDPVTWSVSGTDAADFEISNEAATLGQLTFKKDPPNFEKPVDSNGDNVYMVTVVATDAGVADKNKMTAERAVVVTVKNLEENGTVSLSSVQPKIGFPLTASVTDPDGGVMDITWKWERDDNGTAVSVTSDCSTLVDDDWEDAVDGMGAKTATYTPDAKDEGKCLRATATYTDGKGMDETMKVSVNAVAEDLANRPPRFRAGGVDSDAATAANTGDTATSAKRSINENVTPDTDTTPNPANVGMPVLADDPNIDNLTYTLNGTDAGSFDIAPVTGQISANMKLDREAKSSHMVTVTATDPDGASASIDVTITVTEVDEAPEIAGDDVTTDYRENGTAQVARFTADDPEDRMVYWSLETANVTGVDGIGDDDEDDHAHFSISASGVLSFRFSPDYEMPRGQAKTDGNTNTYRVVVVASDDPTGAGTDGEGAGIMMGYKKVTVNVTDVDETETITLSAQQGQVGVALTATYNDADNERPADVALTIWKWFLGGSQISGADAATYDAPENPGTHRVEASYTKSDGSEKKVSATINVRPEPKDGNATPVFPSGSNARSVDENSPPGTNVGRPVKADDTGGDRLHYTLGGAAADSFDINPATGQITVAARITLDADTTASYSVEVIATDPWGQAATPMTGRATQEVTITINDVNEAPAITAGVTMASVDENTAIADEVSTYTATDVDQDDPVTWSVSGTDAADFEISNEAATLGQLTFKKDPPNFEKPVDSNGDNVYMVTVVATDDGVADKNKMTAERAVVVTVKNLEENGTVSLSSVQPKIGFPLTASVTDPDGGVMDITWKWERDDNGTADSVTSDCSTLVDDDWEDAVDGMGAKTATYTPDAKDEGKCLRATATYTDGKGMDETMKVSVNAVAEDLANRPPRFRAGGVDSDAATAANTGDTATSAKRSINENVTPDTDTTPNPANVGMPVMADDPNDDTLTYTLNGTDAGSFDIAPVTGQISANMKLDREAKSSHMVTVTATDPNGASASIDVTITVTEVDEAPEIMVGGLAISGMSSIRYAENRTDAVAEYTLAGPMKDRARWALEGDDASDFTLMNGTLKFKRSPNYEMPMDMGENNTYEVTIKANDGTYMGTRAVMVMVTNVDEIGTLSGPETVSNYMEDGTDAVGTYTVSGGSMSEMANLTLMGDDAGDFMIMDDGMLKFSSPPNFEAPMDMDMDNTYMVTVKAEAGGEMDMMDVTVTVTNVEEPGMVTLSTMQPMVDTELTATLDDPDGSVSGEMWQWARTMDMAAGWTDIAGAMDASYTPVAMDEGYYLRATVSYTDGHGSGKSAMAMTDNMVTTVQDQAGTVTLSMMEPMVGTELTATLDDPDGSVSGEMWQWARTMDMAAGWTDIAGAMDASYTPVEMDEGYYLRATVSYTDGHGSDKTAMAMTDNMVTTVQDQAGTVTLSMMEPMVGTELTATLDDPDGSVSGEMWQWARTMDMAAGWTDIAGAMDASYTPVAMDEGYYLRATVSYTDGHGSGKSAMAMTDNMVTVTAEDPLVDRYDANDDEMIQKVEVLKAINDYLFGEGDEAISKPDVLRLINLYLFG